MKNIITSDNRFFSENSTVTDISFKMCHFITHKDNINDSKLTENFTVEIQIDGSEFYIDWGDGTINFYEEGGVCSHFYTNNTANDFTTDSDTENLYSKIWQIKITEGIVTFLDAYDLDVSLPQFEFLEFDSLRSLDLTSWFTARLVYHPYIANLSKINCILEFYGLPDLVRFFLNFISLYTVPAKFFSKMRHITNFDQCFSATGLKKIPATLFDYNTNISLNYTFSTCFYVDGPVPELWNRSDITSHNKCFIGCTNASNYAAIPADWK